MTYIVYILQNPDGKFYIGQTNNLNNRLRRDNEGRSKYTRAKGLWELVYQEAYPTRTEAMKRERQLKKWRRELLTNLIANT